MPRRGPYSAEIQARLGTPDSPFYRPLSHSHCKTCDDVLVSQARWAEASPAQRKRMGKPHAGRGYCRADYQRAMRSGQIESTRPRLPEDVLTRLRAQVGA